MKTTTVTKYKYFSADQDEKQEQWLRSMAEQGWHLSDVNIIGGYTFIQGEPDNVAYRLDYMDGWKTENYCSLFEDAGWEQVANVCGYYYWRKRIVDGIVPEIYTDPQSKIAKLKRVLALCLFPVIIFIMLAIPYKNVPTHLVVCLVLFVPFNSWQSYKVYKRIQALRAQN